MNTQTTKLNRRRFIKGFIISAISLEALYVIFGLTNKKNKAFETEKLFDAGNINQFQNNHIYPFASGKFYLSKFEDGGLLAISTKCTHLGCIVQADATTKGYNCPCHASRFNKYGEVLAPPATRALDIYPISNKNGSIIVNTSRPIKRQKFDSSQLTYL